jgi:hypothetical protein
MAITTEPKFPVIIQIVPQPRWQRSLVPVNDLAAIVDSGDPPGWVADSSYQIIDSERVVFTASYVDGKYSFHGSERRVSDNELKELMCANLKAVRQTSTEYVASAAELCGTELFTFTYQWIQGTPDMSAQLRALGCTFIIMLCSLAFVTPVLVVWWLFLR